MVNLEGKVERTEDWPHPILNDPIGCSGCVVLQVDPITSKIRVVGAECLENPFEDLYPDWDYYPDGE